MSLLTVAEVKIELGIEDDDSNTLLTSLIEAVEGIFGDESGSVLESATYTEYHTTGKNQSKIFLKNIPITNISSIHDDPDWDYESADLISASDYTYDSTSGIVYYDGWFFEGFNNVKIIYTAGYSASTLPKSIKQVLIRQVSHWYKDAKGAEWAKSSISQPGGGTIFKKELENNLLPDFIHIAEKYRIMS